MYDADTGQADDVAASRQQGTHTGQDVSVTGQTLQAPAVASRAGANAAAMGASGPDSTHVANGSSTQNGAAHETTSAVALDPATQKALAPTLLVMFKQHSVVNLTDIRYAAEDSHMCCVCSKAGNAHPSACQHKSCVKTSPVACDNNFS